MTTTMTVDGAGTTALTPDESQRLQTCEERITAGIRSFIEMGEALEDIRRDRLYRQSHETFEAYLADRWQYSRSYASRLVASSATAKMLPRGNIVLTEKHLRPLLQFDEADRAKVWADVLKTYPNPTAREVEAWVDNATKYSKEEPYKSIRREKKRAKRQRGQAREQTRREQFATPPKPADIDVDDVNVDDVNVDDVDVDDVDVDDVLPVDVESPAILAASGLGRTDEEARRAALAAPVFDLEQHTINLRAHISALLRDWPARHHKDLADVLYDVADEIITALLPTD